MQHESQDPHLNLFRRFGLPPGGQEYENNVTHALVNTLRLSDPRVTRFVMVQLALEIDSLHVDWTDIAWGLQRPPRSPEAFQNRVVLGISVDGYAPSPGEKGQLLPAPLDPESEDTDSASSDQQSRGIPDAWMYTKQSNTICVLVEVKTRGAIDSQQVQRHERTHFAERGATLRRLDIRWRSVSQALYHAYREHPNDVTAELLSFLSLEGLTATFRFDDATVRLAGGKLPRDVTEDLARRLRSSLRLNADQLIAWPDWQPHVLIFRSFEAVGNIEIWLSGEPPEVSVQTLISVGTATQKYNRLTMPDQIQKLLENIGKPELRVRITEAIDSIGVPLTWTVLDRSVRAQFIDWEFRDAHVIAGLLQAAGRDATPELAECFGEDHPIPGHALDRVMRGLLSLHRAGPIHTGDFKGFSIFARAYLRHLFVPAYGRSPQDVLPLVVEHCVRWHRILRALSGVE